MPDEPTDHFTAQKPPVVLSTTAARQGATSGRIRIVLAVSTALAIIAMVGAYLVS